MKVTVYRRNYSFCVDNCQEINCTSCCRATPIYTGTFLGTSGDNILIAHRDGTGMIEKVQFSLCKVEVHE